jgi:radical SAM protein with 4Fe4S-binding SPASM domain
MYWKLEEGYGLRSWIDTPRALLRASDGEAIPVNEVDFGLLKCCDGVTPLPDGERLRALEARGFIARREAPEPILDTQRLAVYDSWQFSSVNIAVTGRCNYNCRHCFMAKDSGACRSEFSFGQLERMLDDCVRCGIMRVSLTGGEPLLRHDFDQLLRAIAARGMSLANITTNGSLITDELLALMKSLGLRPLMRVSYDGVGWHDWMRGVPGAEDVAIEAIRKLRAAIFRFWRRCACFTNNIGSMRETAELMASLGVNDLRIMRTGESPRGSRARRARRSPFPNTTTRRLISSAGTWRRGFKWMWTSGASPVTPRRRAVPLPARALPEGTCGPDTPLCPDARREVFVGYDGEMSPCSQISGKFGVMGVSLGNVLDAGLEPLLRESRYLDCVRLPMRALTEASEECRACEYLKHCLGGCRAMSFVMTDNYLAPDRMSCVFFKQGYWKKAYDTIKENRVGCSAT